MALAGVEGGDAVEIRMLSVENPAGQDFLLRLVLEVPGPAPSRWELGVTNPFPPDRPTTFVLSVSDEASRAIASASGPPTLVVDMLPADGQSLAAPLEVGVSARFVSP